MPTSTCDSNEFETCLKVLRWLQRQPEQCSAGKSPASDVATEAARLLRSLKAHEKRERKKRDQDLVESTGIRQQREQPAATVSRLPPPQGHADHRQAKSTSSTSIPPVLSEQRRCYVCKELYREVHHFYDLMCPACGEVNLSKRTQSADLSGQTSLVTGGRVKIGFQIALKLLRAGSRVLITSRFPNDAALRYSQETDFDDWRDRLSIHSADFRYLPHVQALAREMVGQIDHLEILINNAAQTIRRPPAYYRHLLEKESLPRNNLPGPTRSLIADSAIPRLPQCETAGDVPLSSLPPATAMTQLPLLPDDDQLDSQDFPVGQLDRDGQQLDRRQANSWVQRLADVSLGELVEVHAVNSLAPYVLIANLEPLLAPPDRDRFIVNVSAMEGKFHAKKTGFHPHTNMAKAAMNMITRTSSARYARERIFMNSVDTGWITNEFPLNKTQQMAEEGFQPPLDNIDGAARVCDPIFHALQSGQPTHGKFYKDYREVSW